VPGEWELGRYRNGDPVVGGGTGGKLDLLHLPEWTLLPERWAWAWCTQEGRQGDPGMQWSSLEAWLALVSSDWLCLPWRSR
jgi:hypothetical protein